VQAANAGGGWTTANAWNIAIGGISGAGVGALAGLVPTSAGPLAALITGALAGGGGNLVSQTATWGACRLRNPSSTDPLKIDFAQAGEQALIGGSTAILGFGAGFSYGYSALQGGASIREALSLGAWMNAWTAGAAQIVTNDLVPIDYGGLIL
jgi:hypothetical protein